MINFMLHFLETIGANSEFSDKKGSSIFSVLSIIIFGTLTSYSVYYNSYFLLPIIKKKPHRKPQNILIFRIFNMFLMI